MKTDFKTPIASEHFSGKWWRIIVGYLNGKLFHIYIYSTHLFLPAVSFGLCIYLSNPSWSNFLKLILFWVIGINFRDSLVYSYARYKQLSTFYKDFVLRFEGVLLKYLDLESGISKLKYQFDNVTSYNRRKYGYRRKDDKSRHRAITFLADFKNCTKIGASNLHYSSIMGTAFLILPNEIEKLKGVSLFYFFHEIGHTSIGAQYKKLLFSNQNILFSVINLAVTLMYGNRAFIYCLFSSCLLLIGKLILTKSSNKLKDEMSADVFAVAQSTKEDLLDVKSMILKYPNILYDRNLKEDQNRTRMRFLLEIIRIKISEPELFDEYYESEETRLHMPILSSFAFFTLRFISLTLLAFAGSYVGSISWKFITVYISALFFFTIIFQFIGGRIAINIKHKTQIPYNVKLFDSRSV